MADQLLVGTESQARGTMSALVEDSSSDEPSEQQVEKLARGNRVAADAAALGIFVRGSLRCVEEGCEPRGVKPFARGAQLEHAA